MILQAKEMLSLGSLPGFRFPGKPPRSRQPRSHPLPLQPLAGSSKGFAKVQEPFEQTLADLWVLCTKHVRTAAAAEGNPNGSG